MGDARTVAASKIITNVQTELREDTTTPRDFTSAILFLYLEKCHGLIHDLLVREEAEQALTGSGSLTTVAGVTGYVLSSNTMGDLLVAHKVWVSGSDPMEECLESDRYPYRQQEELGYTTSRDEPLKFYLQGDSLYLLPYPDDAYTVYVVYYPNYVPLTDTSTSMPFKNIFNSAIEEGMKIIAKHSHDRSVNIDSMLQQIFHDTAMKIISKRSKNDARIFPRMK